jgi:Fe(3+) dicitrate transport protein
MHPAVRLPLFGLVLVAAISVHAQALNVSGQVLDGQKKPIEAARVRFLSRTNVFLREELTGSDGRFSLIAPASATTVEIGAPGFTVRRRALVPGESGALGEIVLQPETLNQQLIVSADLLAGGADAVRRIPGSVEVIDAATFRESRLFTSEEVLRKVSGIHARPEEGFGLRPNIGIRGLNPTRSTQTLLLEDGIPLAYAPYGDNASYYHPPVDRFEGLEVIKGAGQILYGPRTVGGVVNYVTPAIPEKWSGALILTGGNRDYANAHARFGGTVGATGLYFDATRKQGEGSRDNVRSALTDLNFKMNTALSERQSLSFRVSSYNEDSRVTYSGLRQAEYLLAPRSNPFRNDSFDGIRWGFAGTHSIAWTPNLTQSTALYGSYFSRDWWRQSSNSAQRPNTNCGGLVNLHTTCGNEGRLRNYTTWGIDPKFHWRHSAGANTAFDHDFGFRYHDERQDRRQLNGASPLARTGTIVEDNERLTKATSGFWQTRLAFGKFAVTPGVRLEHIRYERTNRLFNSGAGVFGRRNVTQWIPGIGASHTPNRYLTLFTGVHRGFAPPRAEDIINNAGGFVELEPELSWNYEAGGRLRVRSNLSFEATYFRLDYQNQIVPASLAGGVGAVLTNAGQTLHEGVDLSGRWEWRNVAGSGQTVYLRGVWMYLPTARYEGRRFSSIAGAGAVSVTGNRLPYAPRNLGSGSLGWQNRRGIHAFVEAVQTGRQFGDDLNTVNPTADGQRGALPGYLIWNATLNVPIERWKTVAFITTKNLGDRLAIVDRVRGILPNSPRLVQAGFRFDF